METLETRELGEVGRALMGSELPCFVRDAGGRYLLANSWFADLVGLDAERILGKTDSALQPPDLANRSAERDGIVLGSGSGFDVDETILSRDGRRDVRCCRFALIEDGAVWAVGGVVSMVDDPAAGNAERRRLEAIASKAPPVATAPPVAESPVPPPFHPVFLLAPEEPTPVATMLASLRAQAADTERDLSERLREATERAEATEAELAERLRAAVERVTLTETESAQQLEEALARAEAAEALAEREREARMDAEALLRRAREAAPAPTTAPAPDATERMLAAVPDHVPVEWSAADGHRLAGALAQAQTPRTAARAVLATAGAATGWQAGALWRRERNGALRCVDAWTAPGAEVPGWETGAWQTIIDPDAGVAAAALDGEPVWTVGGDCQLARETATAGLDKAVALPAGEGAVLVFGSLAPHELDGDLRDALCDVAAQLGEALDRVDPVGEPEWKRRVLPA